MIDTRVFEGLRLRVYKDTVGKRTIGYGHNLDGGSDLNVIKTGLDPDELRSGTSITIDQAKEIYDLDMGDVRRWIIRLVPNFTDHPVLVQEILLDLGFNMGQRTLSQFRNTLGAFIRKDYEAAADGLEASRWYEQVKSRGVKIVGALRGVR